MFHLLIPHNHECFPGRKIFGFIITAASEAEMMSCWTKDWLDCWSVLSAWSTWVHQYTSAAEDISCALYANPSYQAVQHVVLVLQRHETLPWKRFVWIGTWIFLCWVTYVVDWILNCLSGSAASRFSSFYLSHCVCVYLSIPHTVQWMREDSVLHNVGERYHM
jgi:hypothetical protein